MTIGRASETESEYFIGEITGVQVFDYVLSPEQVKAILIRRQLELTRARQSQAGKGELKMEESVSLLAVFRNPYFRKGMVFTPSTLLST